LAKPKHPKRKLIKRFEQATIAEINNTQDATGNGGVFCAVKGDKNK
jgi:hypothetical protein